jgi:hypothetical protein
VVVVIGFGKRARSEGDRGGVVLTYMLLLCHVHTVPASERLTHPVLIHAVSLTQTFDATGRHALPPLEDLAATK